MFKSEMTSYASNLDALRDFVDLIDPFLDEKIETIAKSREKYFGPIYLLLKRANPDIKLPDEFASEEKIAEEFKGEFTIEENVTQAENDEKHVKEFKLKMSGEDAEIFQQKMIDFGKMQRQKDLLYKSSLITLTSAVEWFFSQILHHYFDKYIEVVGTKEKFFSLTDLKSFNSIEDAQRYLVDTRIEAILRDSFEDWITFLKEKVQLGMGYLIPHRNKLNEVFQRRNIIVHNGGIVNSIYLSKVADELKEGLKINEAISISREYLNDSIGKFELVFILIAAELWKKIDARDEARASLIINLAFKNLQKERWDIAEGLSYFVMKEGELSESTRLYGQLNYWQSIKWQGRYTEIQKEVESADFSGKGALFELALYALTDNIEKFFQLLPEIIAEKVPTVLINKKIEYNDIATWPIFRGIRQTHQYLEFYESNKSKFETEKQDAIDKDDNSHLALPA